MIKYLYVLTSNETDYYYEQFLLSATSLKRVMPNAYAALLVDDKTEKTLIGKRAGFLALINEFKTVALPDGLTVRQRSRYLKTSMRKHIAGDFLYLDCDTIIADDLSEMENTKPDMAAVLNGHNLFSETFWKDFYYQCDEIMMWSCTKLNKVYNSGVLFCRDNPDVYSFFTQWHDAWQFSNSKGIVRDQPSLNHVNYLFGGFIKELDGVWNCQVGIEGFLKYLHNAKIIHYTKADKLDNVYLFGKNKQLQSIKETGIVPPDIMKKLQEPHFLFDTTARLYTYDNNAQLNLLNINAIPLKKAIKIIIKRIFFPISNTTKRTK